MKAATGDRLIVRGHKVGEHDLDAEILEVRGDDGGPPYLVRWSDDGHEGLVFPGPDAIVEHVPRGGPAHAALLDAEVARWRSQLDQLRVQGALAEMEIRQRLEPLLAAADEAVEAMRRAAGDAEAGGREAWDAVRSGVVEAIERVKAAAAVAAAGLDSADPDHDAPAGMAPKRKA